MDELDDLNLLEKRLNEFIAKTELLTEVCYLNHNGENPPKATNYLCQYVGHYKEKVATGLLRIPICDECIAALYDSDWLLFYCLNCNSSQWLIKSKAKKYYPEWESVKFLAQCPNCFNVEKELKDKKDK